MLLRECSTAVIRGKSEDATKVAAHLWKSKCTSVESSDSCSSTRASCPACRWHHRCTHPIAALSYSQHIWQNSSCHSGKVRLLLWILVRQTLRG